MTIFLLLSFDNYFITDIILQKHIYICYVYVYIFHKGNHPIIVSLAYRAHRIGKHSLNIRRSVYIFCSMVNT